MCSVGDVSNQSRIVLNLSVSVSDLNATAVSWQVLISDADTQCLKEALCKAGTGLLHPAWISCIDEIRNRLSQELLKL